MQQDRASSKVGNLLSEENKMYKSQSKYVAQFLSFPSTKNFEQLRTQSQGWRRVWFSDPRFSSSRGVRNWARHACHVVRAQVIIILINMIIAIIIITLPCRQGSGADQSFLNSNSTADLKDHIPLDFKYLHNQSQILSVGDILLTINGVNVLDLPHTQVVRVAQKCKFYNHMDVQNWWWKWHILCVKQTRCYFHGHFSSTTNEE